MEDYSSNSGEDFRTVLEELARIAEASVSIPRPENGKWAKAGFICGNGWSLAWRTFDAQFWGVPQRRRRIAVVVDFRGQRAGEILFERTGVSGNPEPSIPTWKGIARNPAHCSAGYDRVVELAIPVNTQIATRHISLGERTGMGWGDSGDPAYTLQAGHEHAVCCAAFTAGQGAKADGIGYAEKQAPTLRTDGGLSAMQTVVVNTPYQDTTGPLMANSHPGSYCGQDAYTDMFVTCKEVFENHSQDARYAHLENTCSTMVARWGTGGNNMQIVTEKKGFSCSGFAKYTETIGTLRASGGDFGGGSENLVTEKHTHWIVRRLTPTECERLQGFPDGWTDIGEWVDSKGKRHKPADSPRYKALGNSIALPQWWWITCKMATYLPEHATLGSLFDGIGGFPLVWETRHGKGTAVWASEIEEFPIAVTKERFK